MRRRTGAAECVCVYRLCVCVSVLASLCVHVFVFVHAHGLLCVGATRSNVCVCVCVGRRRETRESAHALTRMPAPGVLPRQVVGVIHEMFVVDGEEHTGVSEMLVCLRVF